MKEENLIEFSEFLFFWARGCAYVTVGQVSLQSEIGELALRPGVLVNANYTYCSLYGSYRAD